MPDSRGTAMKDTKAHAGFFVVTVANFTLTQGLDTWRYCRSAPKDSDRVGFRVFITCKYFAPVLQACSYCARPLSTITLDMIGLRVQALSRLL